MKFKKFIVILLAAVFILTLFTSCEKYVIDKEEVYSCTEEFVLALEQENYEYMSTLCHPDWPASPEGLQSFFLNKKLQSHVAFINGVSIKEYKNVRIAAYDFRIKGAYFKLDFYITVDNVDLYTTLEFAKNSHGFGIYNITI